MSLTNKIAKFVDATTGEAIREELCFASLKRGTIIDTVENGRTRVYGKTLDECRAEYPDAQEMTVDAFIDWKAAQQATPIEWEATTEDRFEDMLCCLPPIGWCNKGFLVGEPWDHEAKTGQPRYQAFRKTLDGFLCSSRPLTVKEWSAL